LERLEELREEVDEIDRQLVELIAKRRDTALQIAGEKQKIGKRLKDGPRMDKVMSNISSMAEAKGLEKKEIEAIWMRIINMMIKEQAGKYPQLAEIKV